MQGEIICWRNPNPHITRVTFNHHPCIDGGFETALHLKVVGVAVILQTEPVSVGSTENSAYLQHIDGTGQRRVVGVQIGYHQSRTVTVRVLGNQNSGGIQRQLIVRWTVDVRVLVGFITEINLVGTRYEQASAMNIVP